MDIIPVFLDNFLRHFEHDKKHGFLIVKLHKKTPSCLVQVARAHSSTHVKSSVMGEGVVQDPLRVCLFWGKNETIKQFTVKKTYNDIVTQNRGQGNYAGCT